MKTMMPTSDRPSRLWSTTSSSSSSLCARWPAWTRYRMNQWPFSHNDGLPGDCFAQRQFTDSQLEIRTKHAAFATTAILSNTMGIGTAAYVTCGDVQHAGGRCQARSPQTARGSAACERPLWQESETCHGVQASAGEPARKQLTHARKVLYAQLLTSEVHIACAHRRGACSERHLAGWSTAAMPLSMTSRDTFFSPTSMLPSVGFSRKPSSAICTGHVMCS